MCAISLITMEIFNKKYSEEWWSIIRKRKKLVKQKKYMSDNKWNWQIFVRKWNSYIIQQ